MGGPERNELCGEAYGSARRAGAPGWLPRFDWGSRVGSIELASTQRVQRLVQHLGIDRLSKSQFSRFAKSLDQVRRGFPHPLDAAPHPYLTLDALEVKCRESGRTVNVSVVHAVGVNSDGSGSRSTSMSSPQRTAPARGLM